jgi:hypothetical protein
MVKNFRIMPLGLGWFNMILLPSKHLYHYDQLLKNECKNKRRAETAEWAFDHFEAGTLKKFRVMEGEDNMYDLLETNEEIALYDMTKRMRNTPLFDILRSAE